MNLSTILTELNIPHDIIGDDYFESLGFINDVSEKKLCSFATEKEAHKEISDSISLVITSDSERDFFAGCNLCIVSDPEKMFFTVHEYLLHCDKYRRFRFKSLINRTAKISSHACIAEENVIIGSGVVIEACAVIKENTTIGDNTVVRSGSIIGGSSLMHNHCGGVVIGSDVVIQYNCCVEKALFPWKDTKICDGARIDSLVHIPQGERIESDAVVLSTIGRAVETTADPNKAQQ